MSKVYDYIAQSGYTDDNLIECELCETPINYKEFCEWDELYKKRPLCDTCWHSEDR